MLPNANHLPALPAQLSADFPIPLLVGGDLGIPKHLVAAWPLVAFRAAMPETAIHKYNNPFPSKGEIRLAEKRLVAPPTGDAVLTKYFNQAQLGGFVSARTDQ